MSVVDFYTRNWTQGLVINMWDQCQILVYVYGLILLKPNLVVLFMFLGYLST